jgi:energy-coupling factor transporter transmembrane protein EcfT
MAMLDRGFRFARGVTQLRETSFSGQDFMVLGVTILVLAVLIYAGLVMK